jgi:hypothetical protein
MRPFLLALLALTACAPKLVAPAPQAMNAETQKMLQSAQAQMLAMQMAQATASQSCAVFEKLEPDAAEERLLGSLQAEVRLREGGGLWLDPSVEGERQQLMSAFADGTIHALPPGPKGSPTERVAEIGQKVAKASARPELEWIFGVAKSEEEKTFGFAGGFVFITTGLLKKVSNEAQLAGLLAHEVAHVVKKHELASYVKARHEMCKVAKTSQVLVNTTMRDDSSAHVSAKFADRFTTPFKLSAQDEFARFLVLAATAVTAMGRDSSQEFDSDFLALELVSTAGYEAREFEGIVASLPKESFMPEPSARVARLQAMREGPLKPMLKGKAKADLTKALAPLKP